MTTKIKKEALSHKTAAKEIRFSIHDPRHKRHILVREVTDAVNAKSAPGRRLRELPW